MENNTLVVSPYYRGKQTSGVSELEKILMRRRPDASGQVGPIKDRLQSTPSSTATDELASHLRRRSQAIEEVKSWWLILAPSKSNIFRITSHTIKF